jgi:transmembrane 9 superfamily protein 3
MNTVGPYHNRQETYNYFSLPFCRGTKKEISHYHETLGENILGVELEYSGVDISFKRKIFIFQRLYQPFVNSQVIKQIQDFVR